MKPRIGLVYDPDCPNVGAARGIISEALKRVGMEQHWREYDRSSPGVPDQFRAFGSPTILVDGEDVTAVPPAGGPSCRVYRASHGFRGVPPVDAIVDAIGRQRDRRSDIPRRPTPRGEIPS